jgi:transposase InsO family protein
MEHFENKLDHSKLNVAELSKILKSVSKIFLQPGSESRLKEYREQIRLHGLESMEDIRPVFPKINRQAARVEIFENICQLSLEHPGWGCERLSEALKVKNIDMSASAIYTILVKHQMGTKKERLRKLAETFADHLQDLSPEQLFTLEKFDPCFKERQIGGKHPGELLAQDAIFIGFYKNMEEIYLQVVVDSYSNYVFGFIHIGKNPDYAVAIIHNEVIPFFQKYKLSITAILTDNGREYCGKDGHHYELYLRLNDIEHVKTNTKQCSNIFIKQFKKTIMDEFIKQVVGGKSVDDVEKIRVQLEKWLLFYNNNRPYHGFPNKGEPPIKLITG